jgi:NIPSNAP protein
MILEIRTYRLHPGTRAEFVRTMADEAVPLLRKYGVEVLAYGASLVDEDEHEEAFLIRRFPSLAARDEQEGAFYGSDDWKSGPREAIVSRIQNVHTVVLPSEVLTARAAG